MEEKELAKGTKIKIAIVTVLVILTTLAGISYAFFSIGVAGNEEASSVTVTAALLRLSYSDNLSIGGTSIYPGWSQNKTITVQNTGTDTVYYKIIWREILNQITNDELTISATCVASSGTCNGIPEKVVGTYTSQTSNVPIKNGVEIAPNVTHTYTITVTFKEMSSAQNYNQGKSFYGTLNIAEGKEVPNITRTANTYQSMPIVAIELEDSIEEFYDITNVVNYSSLDSTFLDLIDYDESKSILLSKYNLYVGMIGTWNRPPVSAWTFDGPLTSANYGYGLQSEKAKAYDRIDLVTNLGVAPFSGTMYWDPDGSGIDSKYGTYTNYANNIYDSEYITAPNFSNCNDRCSAGENYSVAYYVENYVSRLGVNATGRLLTYLEASTMTQAQRTNGATYWLGSASNIYGYGNTVIFVEDTGDMNPIQQSAFFLLMNHIGVRPVIVVSTSDIQ